MKTIKANKNKEHDSYNFNGLNDEFEKVLEICSKCKYFDGETDFPNCFCEKNCEMIDYWFCSSKCPLMKFVLFEENEENN